MAKNKDFENFAIVALVIVVGAAVILVSLVPAILVTYILVTNWKTLPDIDSGKKEKASMYAAAACLPFWAAGGFRLWLIFGSSNISSFSLDGWIPAFAAVAIGAIPLFLYLKIRQDLITQCAEENRQCALQEEKDRQEARDQQKRMLLQRAEELAKLEALREASRPTKEIFEAFETTSPETKRFIQQKQPEEILLVCLSDPKFCEAGLELLPKCVLASHIKVVYEARLYSRLGNLQACTESLITLIQDRTDAGRKVKYFVHYWYAKCLLEHGRQDLALDHLRDTERLYPGYEDTAALIEKLEDENPRRRSHKLKSA
ncbi:hypothetical protein WDW86_10040 [Bdellovibrionota bacterium FG-2]